MSLKYQILNLQANFCKIKIDFSNLLKVGIIKLNKRELTKTDLQHKRKETIYLNTQEVLLAKPYIILHKFK